MAIVVAKRDELAGRYRNRLPTLRTHAQLRWHRFLTILELLVRRHRARPVLPEVSGPERNRLLECLQLAPMWVDDNHFPRLLHFDWGRARVSSPLIAATATLALNAAE